MAPEGHVLGVPKLGWRPQSSLQGPQAHGLGQGCPSPVLMVLPEVWSIRQPWDDQKVVVKQQPGAVGMNCPIFPPSSAATSKGKNSSCQVKWKNDQYPAACQVQAH